MTTHCAIVGPRMAVRGQSVRLDVVVRDAPPDGRLRIRLERLWPEPSVHVDEWSTRARGWGTTTASFLWRAAPEVPMPTGRTAVLRATVWSDGLLCASTHGVDVLSADSAPTPGARPALETPSGGIARVRK